MSEALAELQDFEIEPQAVQNAEKMVPEIRATIFQTLKRDERGNKTDEDLEKAIFDAIDTIGPLLKKKKLGRSDMGLMRASLKVFGDELVAMEYLGVEGAKKYFELLSGNDPNAPYILPQALEENDLEAYLFYDMAHDDPDYQDQCAIDCIDDPISNTSLNLLISRLKGNPELMIKIYSDKRLYNNTPNTSTASQFLSRLQDIPSYKPACEILRYYFGNDKRIKLVTDYWKARNKGARLKMDDLRKRIRNYDRDCLKTLGF
jgi:hypothetical protein